MVVPYSQQLALWCQVRVGRKIETIRTDIVKRLYSGHPDAKTFMDTGPPDVEVQMSLKQSRWCITATAERDGPSGTCSVDRT